MVTADTTAGDEPTPPDETALRTRFYQLDYAMDEARRTPEQGDFFVLAAEREDVLAQLRALDPPEASLGDQHNPDHVTPRERPFIASPSDTGGVP